MNEEIENGMKKMIENLGSLTEEYKAEILKTPKPVNVTKREPRLHIDGYFTYKEVIAIIEALNRIGQE